MEILKITSAQNPTIKKFTGFNRRKTPDLILLDGAHLNTEYLKATGNKPQITLVSETFMASNEFKDFSTWNDLICVPDSLMAKAGSTKSSAGILSLAFVPKVIKTNASDLTLIFENVQDPGNVGTMLRTANAMSATQILILGQGADIWSAKCLRAGMGAQFYVNCQTLDDLASWKQNFTGTLVSTSLQGDNLWSSPLPSPLALVFGNEGQGVTSATNQLCDQHLKIPMSEQAESLNVASSLAILTHEFRRQQNT